MTHLLTDAEVRWVARRHDIEDELKQLRKRVADEIASAAGLWERNIRLNGEISRLKAQLAERDAIIESQLCVDCDHGRIKKMQKCCEQALEFVSSIMNHVRDNDEHTIHFVKQTQAWLEKAMRGGDDS